MKTVAVEKVYLPDLLQKVAVGEEFTITQNGQPKAKLTPVQSGVRPRAHAGSLGGKIWMSPDFNAPLDDFKEYQ
jgi:antitoxin (DNA-binding transcriptional repressor) of toxin-antitoxin stability system